MKILLAIPGHLHTVPMGAYAAQAMRELGHQVTVADMRGGWLVGLADRAINDKGKPWANRQMRHLIDRVQPDIFVTIFGFDLSPQTLGYLRQKKIPTACWWINDPFQLGRSMEKAAQYDYVFTNSAGCVGEYLKAGVAHAQFLPTACVPELHKSVAPVEKYRCEVCFAGDHSSVREELMLKLQPVCDLKIFGPWSKKLDKKSPLREVLTDGFFTPQEMVRMFNSAQIVINIHTWYGRYSHGVNPRLFEAAGCGSVQLVDKKDEIASLLKNREEIIVYERIEEVPALVKELLANPEKRKQIGQAAQKRAHAEHTYHARMAQLIETMAAKR